MSEEHPVVLFDGVCNFCDGLVSFLIRQDRQGMLRFAPLQSGAGRALLQRYGLPEKDFGSFVLIDEGKAYSRSSAGLKVFGRLPWYWKWTQLFWLVPPFLRDGIYNFIARNRYKWFGKKAQCMIPTPEQRSRFLP